MYTKWNIHRRRGGYYERDYLFLGVRLLAECLWRPAVHWYSARNHNPVGYSDRSRFCLFSPITPRELYESRRNWFCWHVYRNSNSHAGARNPLIACARCARPFREAPQEVESVPKPRLVTSRPVPCFQKVGPLLALSVCRFFSNFVLSPVFSSVTLRLCGKSFLFFR